MLRQASVLQQTATAEDDDKEGYTDDENDDAL